MDIAWAPWYALNWTTGDFSGGSAVTPQTNWVEFVCSRSIGRSVEIDDKGHFTDVIDCKDYGFITIAKNNYKPDGALGIRILIGVRHEKSTPGNYDLIFIDPEITEWNMSAKYRPLERLKWWYDDVNKSATVTRRPIAAVGEADWASVDPIAATFSKSSTYDFEQGEWMTRATK